MQQRNAIEYPELENERNIVHVSQRGFSIFPKVCAWQNYLINFVF